MSTKDPTVDSDIQALDTYQRFCAIIEATIRQSFQVVQDELESHRKQQTEIMTAVLREHRELTKQNVENAIEKGSQKIGKEMDDRQKPRIGVFSVGHTMVMLFEKIGIGLGFGLGFGYIYYSQTMTDKVAIGILMAIIISIAMPIKLGYQIIFKTLTKMFGSEYAIVSEILMDKKDKK